MSLETLVLKGSEKRENVGQYFGLSLIMGQSLARINVSQRWGLIEPDVHMD